IALIAPQFPFYNIFNIRFLGTSLWQSTELIEMAGDYVQGAIFPSGFFAKSPSGDVKDFVARYKENLESEPGILAATGYDTIRFLEDLIENNKIRTRKDLQDALSEHDNFYGVTGKISFDHQGEVVKEPILLTISGKHLQILH
ncbi:MAG: ABC transporter substrate-binding protein, partial [Deltaproteobacteria bacterium]|nr:ABC transporter substrate-binding protein [Deltaproteobacteria bacterium]